MTTSRSTARRVPLLLGLLLSSCELSEPVTTLRDLEASSVGLSGISVTNGFVSASLSLVDSNRDLSRDEQVLVTLETSSGDRETLGLRRFECEVREAVFAACDEMIVTVKHGNSIEDIRTQAAQLGVRLNPFFAMNQVAVGRAFGSWSFGMDALRRLPAVKDVQFNEFVQALPQSLVEVPFLRVQGAIPAHRGLVKRNDGQLSLRRGDIVTVRYSQPDGSTITGAMEVL